MRTLTSDFRGVYSWKGLDIAVDSSVGNVMLILELFEEERLTAHEKSVALMHLLFDEPDVDIPLLGGDLQEFIIAAMWDVAGLDVSPDRRHAKLYERPVFDFEQDAARIYASFLATYGIDYYDVRDTLDIRRFYMLLEGLPPESEFKQAIYYRTCKVPQRDKYNGEEVERIVALKRHYRLRDKQAERSGVVDSHGQAAMNDLANALRRGATHG